MLDACYVPAQPEQSANYRVLWLLIVVTVTVAPWMLALMFIIHAPAAIFLGLVLRIRRRHPAPLSWLIADRFPDAHFSLS